MTPVMSRAESTHAKLKVVDRGLDPLCIGEERFAEFGEPVAGSLTRGRSFHWPMRRSSSTGRGSTVDWLSCRAFPAATVL